MIETLDTNSIIIGAGPAGLAVAARLRREGIAFEILERSAEGVGSAWRHHYDRLHLHTDKDHSALPFVAWPDSAPRYPSREQVVDYFADYARRFDLEPRLGQNVVAVARHDDGWRVRTEQGLRVRGQNVVVCTGYNGIPHEPTFPGQEDFKGPIVHSSRYKNGAPHRGQRVLVIGFGNSGGEIAIDLHEHGARPCMAVRHAVNIIPKEVLGQPILATSIKMSFLPVWLADLIARPLQRIYIGDITKLGLRQLPYGPNRQILKDGRIPLLDIGTVRLLREGHITAYPGIERFTVDGVVFEDGRREPFDAVVMATGFRPRVDRFVRDARSVLDEEGTPTKSGQPTDLPGLYFCGFWVSPTGMIREIAIESKRIAAAIVAAAAAPAPAGAGAGA